LLIIVWNLNCDHHANYRVLVLCDFHLTSWAILSEALSHAHLNPIHIPDPSGIYFRYNPSGRMRDFFLTYGTPPKVKQNFSSLPWLRGVIASFETISNLVLYVLETYGKTYSVNKVHYWIFFVFYGLVNERLWFAFSHVIAEYQSLP
jgi:hypothetical protein